MKLFYSGCQWKNDVCLPVKKWCVFAHLCTIKSDIQELLLGVTEYVSGI